MCFTFVVRAIGMYENDEISGMACVTLLSVNKCTWKRIFRLQLFII